MEEEKEVKEEVKSSKSNKIFIVEIVIIALFLSFGSGFILRDRLGKDSKESNNGIKENNTNTENNDKENNKVELTTEKVDELLGYLPVSFTKIDSGEKYNVYQNKKISVEDIKTEIILEQGIIHSKDKRINKCTEEEFIANGICDYVVNVSDVKETIKNIYNTDVEILKTFTGGGLLKCTLVGEKYACSQSGGGWATTSLGLYFDTLNNYYVKYNNSKTENGYLYVYVDYVRYGFVDSLKNTTERLDNYDFKLYKYSNTDDLLVDDVLKGKDFYEENDTKTFKEKLFDYLKDNTSKFVNVYKINEDGTYTWVYTEPVK